jgi:quinol monooxygenase YgiN
MNTNSGARFGMVNKLIAKAGQRDAVVEILLAGANVQSGMRGCEMYVVHTSTTDPREIWVTEVWRSKADHEASLQNQDVRALVERGRPMIDSVIPTTTNAVGGKGLSA